MGYCWDHRKISWAIIPNDPWYTIKWPWYFIRRNLKTHGDLATIYLKFFSRWSFDLTQLLSYQSFQWLFRFRQSDPVSLWFRFGSGSVSAVFHHNRYRPSPWPSSIVVVTVQHPAVSSTVHHHDNDHPHQLPWQSKMFAGLIVVALEWTASLNVKLTRMGAIGDERSRSRW